jgi:hypothetical protein
MVHGFQSPRVYGLAYPTYVSVQVEGKWAKRSLLKFFYVAELEMNEFPTCCKLLYC